MLTSFFWLVALVGRGPTLEWWLSVPLLAMLAVVTVLDLRSRLIPDLLTLPALAYAVLVAAPQYGRRGLLDAIVGALVGGGVMLFAAVLTRGAIGGGDVKLMAMLGAAVGWKASLAVLALSQVLGGVVAIVLLAARRADRRTPFPVGALIALFGGLWLSLRS